MTWDLMHSLEMSPWLPQRDEDLSVSVGLEGGMVRACVLSCSGKHQGRDEARLTSPHIQLKP